ncbi:iqgap- protein [Glugoides intestinalis]
MVEQDTCETIGSLISGQIPSTSESMDAKRVTSTIRDFLMKLDQARDWVCSNTGQCMDITKFKEELPKAEILAKVVQALDSEFVKHIYVSPERVYRHTDNIMLFLSWCKKIKLKKHFLFETVDLYESKNIPKVVYCIHGLALFLNKRGTGRGIIINDDVMFSYEEKSLFSEDIGKIVMQRYDDIQKNLDSEEEEAYSALNEPIVDQKKPIAVSCSIDSNDKAIQVFTAALVWKIAFEALFSGTGISVSALRKFIDFDFSSEEAYRKITEQQAEIVERFKKNNLKEIEKDSLVHTIRLLHENINELRGLLVPDYPQANDYKDFKKALYRLIHDYDLCFNIIISGRELPLRTLFPDNVIGDFNFSKFIVANFEKDQNALLALTRTHFISSKTFKSISNAYATTSNMDLNPIAIQDYLKTRGGTRNGLLDDAISDEDVRDEILKRSQSIIDFIEAKIHFLTNIELPYYVKIFSSHPAFFENFLEPAIMSSGNCIISELMGFIFSAQGDLQSTAGQERVYKYGSDFIRTHVIDFSDYAPLKGFLEEARHAYGTLMSSSQAVSVDVNDYFIQHSAVGDFLQVEISGEEINNIIIVLKQCLGFMSDEMRRLVDKLSYVNSPMSNVEAVEVYSETGMIKTAKPITVNGESYFKAQSPSEIKYREVSTPNEALKRPGTGEKFTLNLDNQYSSELDERDSIALGALIRDLKHRVMLLLAISESTSLDSVLNETTEEELHAFAAVKFPDGNLQHIKESVINDIKLLKSKKILRNSVDILPMVAVDILTSKCRLLNKEISLNTETSDALFHKGAMLDKYLHNLYSYVNDLTESMFMNKSGSFFNRQTEPYSSYGTYVVTLSNVRAQVYENLNVNEMQMLVSSDEPMVINVSILIGSESICGPVPIRFDSLLKMRESSTTWLDIGDVCCISVGTMIELINEKYINY